MGVVRDWRPDLLLLTGDLSEDASEPSYRWLAGELGHEVPLLALPGNHDDAAVMGRHFPLGPWQGPLVHDRGNWCLVLADSTRPGKVAGEFSVAGLESIKSAFDGTSCDHILLALHHQPVPVGAPWIDRYPLENPEPFLAVADSEPRLRCIVWGHIHHHFADERNGVLMLGAPSTAANTAPRSARFTLDPAGPSARTLELCEDGAVVYGQLFCT